MKTIFAILALALLSGCLSPDGGGTSGGSPVAATPAPLVPEPEGGEEDPPAEVPQDPITVAVDVRTLTRTEAPINGWSTKTYTATATCARVGGKDFCWDDGVKTVVIPNIGSFTYTYWGAYLNGAGSLRFGCYGGCPSDAMQAPRFMSSAYVTNLTQAAINEVFNMGVAAQQQCTEANGVYTCPGFTIDTN